MNLRSASYTANALNQYSSRSNPASVDIIGLAEVGSSVTVNGSGADYRHGEYFQKDLGVTNNTFAAITVAAGTNSLSGNLYIPPASESYSYDADGNLTADGRWSYLWDAENRLIEMRPQTNAPGAAKIWLKFEYDYLGRRIQKTAAQWTNSAWSLVVSNRFLYDGWNAIAELNATNNNLIRGYLWGIDLSGSLQGAGGVGGLIAVKEGTGDAHFAAYDGNGNVIALVNAATGTYSAQYEYDPFGQTIRATGPMAKLSPYRFSTKYQDGESGLYYYGYRYYDPSTGRWLSRDPLKEVGIQVVSGKYTKTHEFNEDLYIFVENAPIATIDPDGRVPIMLIFTTGNAIGNIGLGCYSCTKLYQCLVDAKALAAKATANLSPDDAWAWLSTAKPGAECAGLAKDCGKRVISATFWLAGRMLVLRYYATRPINP